MPADPVAAFRERVGVDIGRKLPLEAAVDWAVGHGVRHIDLCLDADPALLRDGHARLDAARRRLEQGGSSWACTPCPRVNVAETSPFLSEAAGEYLAAYIRAAAGVGAGWVVVHAGYHFTADRDRRRDAARDRLARAADAAERAGVVLLLENMNREPDDAEVQYLGVPLDECRWFFSGLRSPALRWSFTVNHAHLLPAGIAGFVDGLDLGRCGEVRLADCRGTVEEHLRPGEGTIDFAAALRLIEERGYRGHYMQAFGTLDDMLAGRDTFARLATAAGASGAGDGGR